MNVELVLIGIVWVLVIAELLMILALARQIGQLYRRFPPLGARMMNPGPAVGAVLEPVEIAAHGKVTRLGPAQGQPALLVFVTPTCGICLDLAPALHAIRRQLAVLVLSLSTDQSANQDFARRAKIDHLIDGVDLARLWGVAATPHAVLVNGDGVVAAKGLVNNLEQLESILAALRHPLAPESAVFGSLDHVGMEGTR